jgi:hypothetical protein
MTKDFLLKRYQKLSKDMQESLENHGRLKTMLDNATNAHNVLVGRVEEAYALHQEIEKMEQSKEGESTKKPLK